VGGNKSNDGSKHQDGIGGKGLGGFFVRQFHDSQNGNNYVREKERKGLPDPRKSLFDVE